MNVSFAQLQLEDDLGFSDTIFGLGAGDLLARLRDLRHAEQPSLLGALRGAPLAVLAIMIAWGLVDLGVDDCFIGQRRQLLRAALCSRAWPRRASSPGHRAVPHLVVPRGRSRPHARAVHDRPSRPPTWPAAPISGGLLELDGVAGLDGWQWLFLCEGLPAVGAGLRRAARSSMTGPRGRRVAGGRREGGAHRPASTGSSGPRPAEGPGSRIRDALRSGQVWLCASIYFIILSAGASG